MHVFVDETGDFIGGRDPKFILGGFVTNNSRRSAKDFKKWTSTKFPYPLKRKNEVKFTESRLTEELRLKTVAHLSKMDLKIFCIHLTKQNVPLEYRRKNSKKLKKTGHLYAQVVAEALGLLLPTSDKEFRVWRDKRRLQGISLQEFDELIKLNIKPKLFKNSRFSIDAVDSKKNTNIQIADWICGALGRFHNNKRNGDKFKDILQNNIIKEDELFPGYWENLFE